MKTVRQSLSGMWRDQRGQNLLESAAICSFIGAGLVCFMVASTAIQSQASETVKTIMGVVMRLITA